MNSRANEGPRACRRIGADGPRPALRVLAVGLAGLAVLGLAGCGAPPAEREGRGAPVDGIRFLGSSGASAGFARAEGPRRFAFPVDHGPHPAFRTEWWYFTGNLLSATGRHFGFELTFFRVALAPEQAGLTDSNARGSAWASRQVWLAQFAVTDTEGGRFLTAERSARGALGLAGATGSPFAVWVESFAARSIGDSPDRLRLSAATEESAIELDLDGLESGIVLQGRDGFDRKGPEPGNASYYYSAPRLGARGMVRVGQSAPVPVEGVAWLDREWGTSALSPGVAGWDWFGLELDDGRDLMFYRLRRDDGTASEWSGGTLVGASGTVERLAAADVEVEPVERWTSQTTGVTYPVAWLMRIPGAGLELRITPRLRDQEIDLSVRYWEGAVEVAGRAGRAPIEGRGYLELAGY